MLDVHDYVEKWNPAMARHWDGYKTALKTTQDAIANRVIRESASVVSRYEVEDKFPDSQGIATETYHTIHPLNSKALVVLAGFHACIAEYKDLEMLTVLGRLGAKKVIIEEKELNEVKTTVTVGVALDGLGEAEAASKMYSNIDQFMNITASFSGKTDPTVTTNILSNTKWNSGNGQLLALVQGRLPGSVNRISNITLTYRYTEKFTFDIKATAAILDLAEAELVSNHERFLSKSRTFEVAFGD